MAGAHRSPEGEAFMSIALIVLWMMAQTPYSTVVDTDGTPSYTWSYQSTQPYPPAGYCYDDLIGHKTCNPPREEMDVPAIQIEVKNQEPYMITEYQYADMCMRLDHENTYSFDKHACLHWTCTDKRRVKLMSEDGERHCVLFKGIEN